jgi:hypothetical protein
MPASFEIDHEKRLVLSYAWGDVSFDDIAQHRKALRDNPEFDETYDQLCFWTKITSVRISYDELRLLANEQLFAPSSRRAFVVPDELTFGLLRMFQVHSEANTADIMVFPGSSEALAWLNRLAP